jgi:hypothetical protein
MLSPLAIILLRFHILKKIAQLPVPAQLRYLQFCRRVHGIMMPFCALCSAACVFIAICALVPALAAMVHLSGQSDNGMSDGLASTLFLLFALFFGILISILFVTREMLAAYWLLIFSTYYVRHQPSA